jgi:hypothetical protein
VTAVAVRAVLARGVPVVAVVDTLDVFAAHNSSGKRQTERRERARGHCHDPDSSLDARA